MSLATDAFLAARDATKVKDYEIHDFLIEECLAKCTRLDLTSSGAHVIRFAVVYEMPDSSELEVSIITDINRVFKRLSWSIH